jgi:hypothetical protein
MGTVSYARSALVPVTHYKMSRPCGLARRKWHAQTELILGLIDSGRARRWSHDPRTSGEDGGG